MIKKLTRKLAMSYITNWTPTSCFSLNELLSYSQNWQKAKTLNNIGPQKIILSYTYNVL